MSVRLVPVETGGICFHHQGEEIVARPENVTDTRRCTKLGSVSTVEHLMSALAGLEITDLRVEVEGDELPGLDGSSKPYVDAILASGLQDLDERSVDLPFKRTYFVEGECKVAIARGEGHWRFVYDVGDRWPGQQVFESLSAIHDYAEAIAPARTFALAEEVPQLITAGLGQGLDEQSALILGIEGYKNDPRFEDEPARHKLLDLMGDLYLSGIPIRFLNVSAEKSGHRCNVLAAKLLQEHALAEAKMALPTESSLFDQP